MIRSSSRGCKETLFQNPSCTQQTKEHCWWHQLEFILIARFNTFLRFPSAAFTILQKYQVYFVRTNVDWNTCLLLSCLTTATSSNIVTTWWSTNKYYHHRQSLLRSTDSNSNGSYHIGRRIDDELNGKWNSGSSGSFTFEHTAALSSPRSHKASDGN